MLLRCWMDAESGEERAKKRQQAARYLLAAGLLLNTGAMLWGRWVPSLAASHASDFLRGMLSGMAIVFLFGSMALQFRGR